MKLMSVKETAPMVGKTYRSLAKLIAEKKWSDIPPVYKIGSRHFFKDSEVIKWIDEKRCC